MFSPRRDGTVTLFFPTAGRDGSFLFLGRAGTVHILSTAERDGKCIFLVSCCKVGAVVPEDFPALLVARRGASRRRRFSSRLAAQASRSAATTRATFARYLFPPLPQVLLLRCQFICWMFCHGCACAMLLVVVEVGLGGGGGGGGDVGLLSMLEVLLYVSHSLVRRNT